MEHIRNAIITGVFLIFTGIMAVVLRTDERIAGLLLQDDGAYVTAEDLPFKNGMVELNGMTMKLAGVRSYYSLSNGISITSDGYNVGGYGATSTDYEVEQMKSFRSWLDERDIRLLYVNEPAKYIDDAFYTDQFGGESYLNRNADLFLQRIGDAGINYIDLRDNILSENIDPLTLFYRTDHHWTVPASKWAAAIIAEKLNTDYGYQIDMSLYDDARFHTVEYKDAWLGEQGKKVAGSYIGLDDYTMMEPAYPTDYAVYPLQTAQAPDLNPIADGDFGIFIRKNVYNTEIDPYASPSWHYSYLGSDFENGYRIQNRKADYGNVLILGDSYESSMLPFLTLGIQNTTLFILRDLSDGESIRRIVEQDNYDTVIITYAQFMIGAHDDASSANYRMFTLE